MKRLLYAAAAASALCLSACGDDSPPSPTAADLSVITQGLDEQLADPAKQIRETLKQANSDKRVYSEEMFVRGEGQLIPVDWWDYDQGLIQKSGVDAYSRGYFAVTPKGQALLNAPTPHWLVSRFKGAPQVNCEGTKSSGSCTVTGVAQVTPTAQAGPMFEGRTVPDQPFQATVQYDPSGWSLQELHTSGQTTPQDAARLALLGDDAAMAKARSRFYAEVSR